jgi:hypothetical protein
VVRREALLAVLPGEAEGAYLGDTDPSHNVANSGKNGRFEVSAYEVLSQCEARLKVQV